MTDDQQPQGRAKNYLDDLNELNAKALRILNRGVRERNISANDARKVAQRLGIGQPDSLRKRRVYFERIQLRYVEITTASDEEAIEKVKKGIENGHAVVSRDSVYDNLDDVLDFDNSVRYGSSFSTSRPNRPDRFVDITNSGDLEP